MRLLKLAPNVHASVITVSPAIVETNTECAESGVSDSGRNEILCNFGKVLSKMCMFPYILHCSNQAFRFDLGLALLNWIFTAVRAHQAFVDGDDKF